MKGVVAVPLLCLLVFCSTFQECLSAVKQPSNSKKHLKSSATHRFGSSVVFPVTGNVYPQGYYHVTLNIGHPPRPYFLDIDTGSDLTWLQCDAPCTKCLPAPHSLYKPNKDIVRCKDPLCTYLHWPENHPCETPEEQCDYEVEYADHGSSLGVLVKDSFSLSFTNGSVISPRLALGCGYNQEVADSLHPPYTDGVLGLGNGKSSIIGQLHELGLTRNVVGHCLSGKGAGFLFFGADLVPSSGINWAPMLSDSMEKHYSLGPAELHFSGKATGVKGLPVVFDSGSTYTYFNLQAYSALVSLLRKDIKGTQLQDAKEDSSLPVCWKGTKPLQSVHDVKTLFNPVVLRFANAKKVQLQMPPETYLIVTDSGNVCLGILNGSEVGLGDFNVIGDISLQDKIVIYDNEKQQIGWAPANCNRLPNVDRDYNEGFSLPCGTNLGILEEYCPANLDY